MDSEERTTTVHHVDVGDMTACPNFAEAQLSEEVLTHVPELSEHAEDLFARAFNKLGGGG